MIAVALMAPGFLFEPVGPLAGRAAYGVAVAAVVIFVIFRFGLLALPACAYVVLLGCSVPLTLDADAWYFGRSAAALTLIAAVTIAGFAFAVREKHWLPRFTFD